MLFDSFIGIISVSTLVFRLFSLTFAKKRNAICPFQTAFFFQELYLCTGNTRINRASTLSLLNERTLPLGGGLIAEARSESCQGKFGGLLFTTSADFQNAKDICVGPYIYPHIYPDRPVSCAVKNTKLESRTRGHYVCMIRDPPNREWGKSCLSTNGRVYIPLDGKCWLLYRRV